MGGWGLGVGYADAQRALRGAASQRMKLQNSWNGSGDFLFWTLLLSNVHICCDISAEALLRVSDLPL